MAESFSVERRRLMRFWARVVLTPAPKRATGMVKATEALAARHGWFMTQQFENPANPAYHRNTTGPEVLSDFADRRLDYFVSGYGTGGTITGAGQMIRLARPDVQIISTEPAGASLLGGKEWQPHKIQGWTPDFIPDVLDRKVAHRNVPVTDDEAISTAKALAVQEGIFCGISSGGTFAAALKVVRGVARSVIWLFAGHGRAPCPHRCSLMCPMVRMRRKPARRAGILSPQDHAPIPRRTGAG
jgi:cysteine synthase A